jgi:hypothetical protein
MTLREELDDKTEYQEMPKPQTQAAYLWIIGIPNSGTSLRGITQRSELKRTKKGSHLGH